MIFQDGVAWRANLLLSVAFAFPVAFTAVAVAQDTLQSLSAQADALSVISGASEFVVSASDILGRAQAALTGNELNTIRDKIGNVAANWLHKPEIGPSLNADAAEFLFTHGLEKLGAQRSGVAAEWILQPNAMDRYSAVAINRLSEAASSALTQAQRDDLLAQSRASLGDLNNLAYEELKEHVAVRTQHLYSDSESGRVARRQIVIDWAENRDPASLEIEAVDWAMMEMLPKWMSEYPPQEIDATWEARIVPPRSGQYKFALSPLKLTATREEGDHKYFRLWLTVQVNGQTVLVTQPGSWPEEGSPISLQAGQAVAVRMTLRYRMAGYVPLPASGQLYWSGPGIERQLIDDQFYQLPDVDEPGVKLSVERRNGSGLYNCDTVVGSIDQVLGKHAICEHEQLLNRYIERRLDHFLSPAFMNEALAAATRASATDRVPHPLMSVPDYRGIVNKCSSKLRQRMATEFALRPELMEQLDPWTMVYFHDAVRFGAEREALDMLGAWMNVHADRTPELVENTEAFFEVNRHPYRHLIIPLVLEHPESAEWFEEDYLVTAEGTCSLPAATVVAYSHLVSGKLLEWIHELDARLDDPATTGDARVNWLIARAMAEEIRGCPQDHVHYPGCHQFGEGMGWLDEAMLVAQSPKVKARAAVERAARLVLQGKWTEAEAALDGFLPVYTPQVSVKILRPV